LVELKNTDTSLLRHLLQLYGEEFRYFRERLYKGDESTFQKLEELEKAVLNRDTKLPMLRDSTKVDVCIWAALRTVCTFRNLYAQCFVNRTMYLIARLQTPTMAIEEVAEAIANKCRFVVGFQVDMARPIAMLSFVPFSPLIMIITGIQRTTEKEEKNRGHQDEGTHRLLPLDVESVGQGIPFIYSFVHHGETQLSHNSAFVLTLIE